MSVEGEREGKALPEVGRSTAKNRMAQQRYRQRQKEKRDNVQRQLQVLTRRLENVELVNKSLNERNRLLERLASLGVNSMESQSKAQESDRAPPLTANLAEKRAAAMAKFINTVRRNKPPVVTVEGLTQAVCEDMEPLKFEYVHNLTMLMGEEQREELTTYIMDGRKAREEMMQLFDLRDLPTEGGFKRYHKSVPIPFKMSMVHAMQLSEAQKDELLEAKRAMTLEYDAIVSARMRSTEELKKSGSTVSMSAMGHSNHKEFVTALVDGLEANEAFMESLKAEHKCLLRYYATCAQLVTPLQEARCLVEGYADGMWMDFWVLPMIIEAERGNSLPAWLKEYNKEGTYNLPLKTLIGADPYPQSSESSAVGGLVGNGLNSSGSEACASPADGAVDEADDFFSSLPLDYGVGFDSCEADMFAQLFPSVAT